MIQGKYVYKLIFCINHSEQFKRGKETEIILLKHLYP
jgi:hypothetical protein